MARGRANSNSSDQEKEIHGAGIEAEKPRPVVRGIKRLAVENRWSELPGELVINFLQRLKSYQDFVCATSSCGFWRLIGTKSNDRGDIFCGGGNQFPWLMLAEEEGCSSSNTNLRAFYNVRKNTTCYLELPEISGRKHCVSSHGWLVTVDSSLEINVVHPLTRVQTKLPDIYTSLNLTQYSFQPLISYYSVVEKAVFSSSPGKTSEDYTVSILFGWGRIGLWWKGDNCWKALDEAGKGNNDIVFYKGRFYGINIPGLIYTWDTQGTTFQEMGTDPMTLRVNHGLVEKMYLVESDGFLLVVSRESDPEDLMEKIENYGTYKFQVHEVKWCKSDGGDWRRVSDLGGRSLFLGHSSSFSIDASDFPGCKPNCIYFTDDLEDCYHWAPLGGGKDMGIYHLEDGRIERFPVQSFSFICPPLWVQLNLANYYINLCKLEVCSHNSLLPCGCGDGVCCKSTHLIAST